MTEAKKKTWENRSNRPKKKKKRKPAHLRHSGYWMVCCDCGETQRVEKRSVHSRFKPRCMKCGGPLNFKKEMQ